MAPLAAVTTNREKSDYLHRAILPVLEDGGHIAPGAIKGQNSISRCAKIESRTVVDREKS